VLRYRRVGARGYTGPVDLELRHAVVDGPDGLDACEVPTSRTEALTLRARHDNRFWCTTQAGGCGGRLELAAGEIVAPYFRHEAGVRHCPLMRGDRSPADAYFHLAYQRALARWLRAQGYTPSIEHRFADGGGRADLHVSVESIRHSIEVQLSSISVTAWRERTARYADHVDQVTWLHGPQCESTLTADLLANTVWVGPASGGRWSQRVSSPRRLCRSTGCRRPRPMGAPRRRR
jgi:hypothetical protein